MRLRMPDFSPKLAAREAKGPDASLRRQDINQAEARRVRNAFKEAYSLIFGANPDKLQTDNPGVIALIDEDFKGKSHNDPLVQANAEGIAKKRKIVTERSEIAKEDKFKSMPETSAEEKALKQKAIEDEVTERTSLTKLQETYDIIYTIQACEVATSPQGITDAVTLENKRRLDFTPEKEIEFLKTYKEKHQSANDAELKNALDIEYRRLVGERPGAVMTANEEAEFKKNYVASYRDENGNYHKIDPKTGKPIPEETIRHNQVY